MDYQVLARKWRPQNFTELVGQTHVQRALSNALDNDRLHHAYLFTGTRGVGKTTIARILAKSLNCESGVSSNPCGTCTSCQEITEGRFVDLIEVDAASRTKVEDTRELLDNVQYAPTKGRYKVYLIDEVHMLSNHSFNALLKTLEEPPPHVKFLLATTDPQRLPVTVLSRCLQFHLKRLTVTEIQEHLSHILAQENIETERTALIHIARSADGSIRDGLSLLDQAIAYGAGSIKENDVLLMLGAINHQDIAHLLLALATADPAAVLKTISDIALYSMEFDKILSDLITAFHHIALLQLSPESVNSDTANFETLQKISTQLSPEDIQLYYQIAIMGRRDLHLSPDSKLGIEMILLRMLAFKPIEHQTTTAIGQTISPTKESSPPKQIVTQQRNTSATTNQPMPAPVTTSTKTNEPVNTVSPDNSSNTINKTSNPTAMAADGSNIDWESISSQLDITGMAKQLALHCSLQDYDGKVLQLLLSENQAHLLSDSRRDSVVSAINALLPEVAIRIELAKKKLADTPAELQQQRKKHRIDASIEEIDNDQVIQQFKQTFDATIAPGSVEPIEK